MNYFLRSMKSLPKLYSMDPTNETDYSGVPYAFGIDPVRLSNFLIYCTIWDNFTHCNYIIYLVIPSDI